MTADLPSVLPPDLSDIIPHEFIRGCRWCDNSGARDVHWAELIPAPFVLRDRCAYQPRVEAV